MPGNLQDAIAAMLTAKTAEELDGAIVGAVAEAAGFRRAALFAPPTEEAAAVVRVRGRLGYAVAVALGWEVNIQPLLAQRATMLTSG